MSLRDVFPFDSEPFGFLSCRCLVSRAAAERVRAPPRLTKNAPVNATLREKNTITSRLSPAQQRAFDVLQNALPIGNVFVLTGDSGMGKTTVLREVERAHSGVFLSMSAFLSAMQSRHPFALEETFEQWVRQALEQHERVLVDDLHLLQGVIEGCTFYPRSNLLNMQLTTLAVLAGQANKKLIFATEDNIPPPLFARCYRAAVQVRIDRMRGAAAFPTPKRKAPRLASCLRSEKRRQSPR